MAKTEEYRKSEKPFMDQLGDMGWTVEEGDLDVPYLSGERDSFRDVLLKDDLEEALRRINCHQGTRWLDENRIDKAVNDVDRLGTPNPSEANQEATRLVRKGTAVDRDPELPSTRSTRGTLKTPTEVRAFDADRNPPRKLSRLPRDADHSVQRTADPIQVRTFFQA